jgi:L-lactate permease
MPEAISTDIINLFMFVIPGFITVWSFRYFTDSKKNADFEYFALSVFWGLMILFFNELIAAQDKISELLKNPFATAGAFSIFGLIFGWIGSALSRARWFQFVMSRLKKIHI